MYGNNFGVIEVASAKTTAAPGWAYVPDNTAAGAASSLQAPNRKRAARLQASNLSSADLNARQEAKLRKDLEALDRDSGRDVVIPIPSKPGGPRNLGKSTANVRKILQSQKTFSNHLDDYEALLAQGDAAAPHPNQHTSRPNPAQPTKRPQPNQYTKKAPQPNQYTKKAPQPNQYTKKAPQPNQYTKRKAAAAAEAEAAAAAAAAKQKEDSASSRSRLRRSGRGEATLSAMDLEPPETEDVEMVDAPPASRAKPALSNSILTPYDQPRTAPHESDANPLLASVLPELPSDEELRKLLTHPPLTYTQARAKWTEEDRRYPARVFCEVCGYWGRVRCMKCGTRVCALDCLEVHREECFTRYGV